MMRRMLAGLMIAGVCFGGAACSTAPTTEAGRQALGLRVDETIANFKKQDPTLASLFESAYGYAVFPTVGKGAVGVGGAYGRGQVFEQGKLIGYCDLTQGSIGFQLGGQSYSEIIFFENKAALDRFKSGEFALAAQASAVAAHSGTGANAKFSDGVLVFTMGEAGLMYEASVGGQKFEFLPL